MEEELIKVLLFIAALPVVLLGKYIYDNDRNKEPKKLITKIFIGGILSCFLVLFFSYILELIVPIFAMDESILNYFQLFIYVFIKIALVEEFCKWIISYFLSYNNKEFDELYDMIVYCVFASLGFALFENILYVLSYGFMTGILRALLSVPMHACFGVSMGYCLGLAKLGEINNNKKNKFKNIILSILIPTILHGFYDYLLFTDHILVAIVLAIGLYIISFYQVKKFSNIFSKIRYKNKFCTNCGLNVTSDFCPNCGKKHD